MLSISPVAPVTLSPGVSATSGASTSLSFGALVAQMSAAQNRAEAAVAAAVSGQGSVTQAMIDVSEAQTGLDVAAAVRNALLQSANTIMNWSV